MNIMIMVGEIQNAEYLPSLGLDGHEMVHVNNFRDNLLRGLIINLRHC